MGDLTALDAEALSRAIAAREISCVEVMAAFLHRIDSLNPRINAIVSLSAMCRSPPRVLRTKRKRCFIAR